MSINRQHGAKGTFPSSETVGIKVLAMGGGYFGLALVWPWTEWPLAVPEDTSAVSHPAQMQFACSKTTLQCRLKRVNQDSQTASFHRRAPDLNHNTNAQRMSLTVFRHDPSCN